MAEFPVDVTLVTGGDERANPGGVGDLASPERAVEIPAGDQCARAIGCAAELAVEMRKDLEAAGGARHLFGMRGRIGFGLDVDIHASLECGREIGRASCRERV